ncbi:BnaCnng07760D [Brassica napus]|uniref:BnaCnng07760D protein n=1 Tax=Brassica napus TaxID=3708 RepID=A0A078HGZ7_BRANA|nr:BnaCnng07760D [Brassica napus]
MHLFKAVISSYKMLLVVFDSLDGSSSMLQFPPVPSSLVFRWECFNTKNLISLNGERYFPGQLQSFLLHVIFKKFSSQSSLKISLQGNVYILSRNGIKKRVWECCKKLFSVLCLCLSSGSWTDGTKSYVSEKDPV